MLRPSTSLLLSLLWLVTGLPAQERFAIGTWNIEFLGADPQFRRDTAPRTADDMQAIGAKIRDMGVAALAVQEICGEAPLQQVCAAAGPTWRYLLGTSGSWDDGKTQQGIGFLYDDAVLELLYAEELLAFPRERDGAAVFHRKPVTACFRHRATGCDFRLVTVHFKAGQKKRDHEKRRIEAVTLREWIDGLQAKPGEDPDVIVLGDFNSSYGDEPERILERGGALRYLEPEGKAPTIVWFDDPIDQIVVARGFAEVQRQSMQVLGVTGERERLAWRKTYSDHFPVMVTIRSSGDDDPDATFARGPATQELPVARRAAAPAAAAGDGIWPVAVGSEVLVIVDEGGRLSGKLLQPVPMGPGGWLVVRTADGVVAVPLGRVRQLQVR